MRHLSTAAALLLPATAFAHAGYDQVGGFGAGLAHPFAGLDHMVAMVALGLWAPTLGGRETPAVPAAFLAGMIAAWLLGVVEPARSLAAIGVFVSAVLLPIAVGAGLRMPVVGAVVVAALIGVLHGHAHGDEIPAGRNLTLYAAGFLMSAAALLALGYGVATAAMRMGRAWLVRVLSGGAVVALLYGALF